jgi:hypothetical protein
MADPVISGGLGVLWLGVRLRSSPTDIFGQVASVLLMAAGIVITAHHAPQVAGPGASRTSQQARGPASTQPGGWLVTDSLLIMISTHDRKITPTWPPGSPIGTATVTRSLRGHRYS